MSIHFATKMFFYHIAQSINLSIVYIANIIFKKLCRNVNFLLTTQKNLPLYCQEVIPVIKYSIIKFSSQLRNV